MTAQEAIKAVLVACGDDTKTYPPKSIEAASRMIIMGAFAPELARALQVAIEALMEIKTQNRTRGYPSGMEWIKLDEKTEKSLAEIDKIFNEPQQSKNTL